MYKILILFLLLTNSQLLFANESCSRTATINYQKVLVDAGSRKRGEGLRFFLEKDPVSKKLLDHYQEKDKPTILNASVSTAGSLMILAGLVQTSNAQDVQQSNTLIYTGALLVALNYLVSRTLKLNNEKVLDEAVKEYNKRNTPRIYFSPYNDNNGNSAVGLGIQQEF